MIHLMHINRASLERQRLFGTQKDVFVDSTGFARYGLYGRYCRRTTYGVIRAQWDYKEDADSSRLDTCNRVGFQAIHRTGTTLGCIAMLLGSLSNSPTAALAIHYPNDSGPVDSVVDESIVSHLPPLPTEFPPLPDPIFPKFQRFTLDSGLRVILEEDHELPFIRGIVAIKGGERLNPESNPSIASLAAALQRGGGTVLHPEETFDKALDRMSAAIEGSAGKEAVTLGFSCLREDFQQVFGLFSEMIEQPKLPEYKLDQFKVQYANALMHVNDNPSSIPPREVSKLIYGEKSVYVREPTANDVLAATVQEIQDWIQTSERPENSVLGIVGDFSSNDMQSEIRKKLGDWRARGPPKSVPNPGIPSQTYVEGKIYLIDRPDVLQSSVAVAEPGVAIMDPDEAGLGVLGGLLNNFGGTLFDSIRSRQGLAYSVSAGWSAAPVDHPGLFMATAETNQPVKLLKSLQEVLQMSTQMEPSRSEVERIKEEVLNSFVFSYSNQQTLLRRAVIFDLFGIPDDYVYSYKANVEKVTPNLVLKAARNHLHPKQQTTVIIGNAKKIYPELKSAFPDVSIESLKVE